MARHYTPIGPFRSRCVAEHLLPSILALPDRTVLSILREYQHNSDPLVREYSTNAIYTFYDNPLVK